MQEREHHDQQKDGHDGIHAHGTASEEGDRARRHLSDVTERVRSEASRAGEVGRRRSAEMLRSVSRGAREAGDGSNESSGAISRVLGDAADYVERADLKEIGTEAVSIARQHPAAVLSGLAVLGFAAGRVLSAKPPRSSPQDRGGESGGRSPGGDGRFTGTTSAARGPAQPGSYTEAAPRVTPLDPENRPDPIGTRPAHRP